MASTALQRVNTQITTVEKAKQTAIEQYHEILSHEDSLAWRVFQESSDKENPISLPVIEYLQETGFVKIHSISRLPQLQAQGMHEELYSILNQTEFGVDIYKEVRKFLGYNACVRLSGRSKGKSLIREGLTSLGIDDSKLVTLFHQMDLVQFIEYVGQKYPQTFEGIPASGPNLPVAQLHYYTEWKSAIEQLGMSRLRKQCRDWEIDEEVLQLPDRGIASKSAMIDELAHGGWISPAIQSIDVYARARRKPDDDSVITGLELFAFVEQTQPKGLIMSYAGHRYPIQVHEAQDQIQNLFQTGLFKGEETSLEQVPSYLAWKAKQPNPRISWPAYVGTFGGIALGGFLESQFGVGFWAQLASVGTVLSGLAAGVVTSVKISGSDEVYSKAVTAGVQSTIPYHALSWKGQHNYFALYQLENKLGPSEKKKE